MQTGTYDHGRTLATWACHLYAVEALRHVLALADAHGIDVLPVKGIVTARSLYEDPAERPISDVDLRVRPRDVKRLRDLGVAAGWRLVRWSAPYENAVFDLDQVTIDIEAHVGPPGVCSLTVNEMLSRATLDSAVFGFPHREPDIHDHALLLCVNAFKDKIVHSMPWALSDLDRLVTQEAFDEERFVRLARASSASTIVGIVADWMARVRGVQGWARVSAALGPPTRPRYSRLVASWITRQDPWPLAMRFLARAASDTPADRAPAIARMIAWQLDMWSQRARKAFEK